MKHDHRQDVADDAGDGDAVMLFWGLCVVFGLIVGLGASAVAMLT